MSRTVEVLPIQVEPSPLQQRIRLLSSIRTVMDQAMLAMRCRYIHHIVMEHNTANKDPIFWAPWTAWHREHADTAAFHVIPRVAIYNDKPNKAEQETIRGISQALQNGDIQPLKQAFNNIAALEGAEWLTERIGKNTIPELYEQTKDGIIILASKQQSLLEEMIGL